MKEIGKRQIGIRKTEFLKSLVSHNVLKMFGDEPVCKTLCEIRRLKTRVFHFNFGEASAVPLLSAGWQ